MAEEFEKLHQPATPNPFTKPKYYYESEEDKAATTFGSMNQRMLDSQIKLEEWKKHLAQMQTNPYIVQAKKPELHPDWTKNYKEVTDVEDLTSLLQVGIPCYVFDIDNTRTSEPLFEVGTDVKLVANGASKLVRDMWLKNWMEDKTILVEVE